MARQVIDLTAPIPKTNPQKYGEAPRTAFEKINDMFEDVYGKTGDSTTGALLQADNNLSDVADVSVARVNLGLKDLATKNEDELDFVSKTGDESIDGVKTFTSSPIVPAVADPVTNSAAAISWSVVQSRAATDLPWMSKIIGEAFPLDPGAPTPPQDSPYFKYVLLTAGSSYNTGYLTSESVTGTGSLTVATAVISYASSSMNGKTINLLNSSRRILRPGGSGTSQDDSLQNITGLHQYGMYWNSSLNATGAFNLAYDSPVGFATGAGVNLTLKAVTFDASRFARTAGETRMANIGVDFWMRIA